MAIQVFCECGTALSVKPELAGKKVKCKTCGTVLKIPALGDGAAAPPAAPAGGEPPPAEMTKAEEFKPDYEVVKEGEKQVSCPACGAFCAPTDAACLACGAELEGQGGSGLLGKVPRPVLFGAIALIGFGSIGLGIRAAWQRTRPSAYARDGFERFKAGDHAEARKAFEAALTYDPTYREAIVGLAEIGVATNDERLIDKWSSKAIELLATEPLRRAPIRLGLAKLKLGQGDYKTARNEAIDARDEDPSLAGVARGIVGRSALLAGQPDEALAELRVAASSRTDDWHVLRELTKLLVERELWGEAKTAAEQCVKLESKQAEAWLALAELRLRDGDRPQAKAALLEVIKLDDKSAVGYAMLSGVHLADEKLDEAFEAAKKAVDLAPNDAATHLALGRVILAQQRPKAAQEELEKATKGGGWEAEFLLGKALLLTKDTQGGLRRLTTALDKRPDDVPLHIDAAKSLIEAGNGQGATTLLTRALAKDDHNYDAHVLFAKALTAQDNGKSRFSREIQDHLHKAIDIDAARREAPLMLGNQLLDKGDVDAAITVLSNALTRSPQDKDLLYWKGRACIRAKKWDDAILALDALRTLDPNYLDAEDQLRVAQQGKFYDSNPNRQ